MQFHGNKNLDFFYFTSFFAWTFFNFLARCVLARNGSNITPINYFIFFLQLITTASQQLPINQILTGTSPHPISPILPKLHPILPRANPTQDPNNGALMLHPHLLPLPIWPPPPHHFTQPNPRPHQVIGQQPKLPSQIKDLPRNNLK